MIPRTPEVASGLNDKGSFQTPSTVEQIVFTSPSCAVLTNGHHKIKQAHGQPKDTWAKQGGPYPDWPVTN